MDKRFFGYLNTFQDNTDPLFVTHMLMNKFKLKRGEPIRELNLRKNLAKLNMHAG